MINIKHELITIILRVLAVITAILAIPFMITMLIRNGFDPNNRLTNGILFIPLFITVIFALPALGIAILWANYDLNRI